MDEPSRNVNFRWSPEFIARIDKARGLIPRSAYVRQALERQMTDALPPPPTDWPAGGRVVYSAADDVRAAVDAVANEPLGLRVKQFVVPPSYVKALGKGPVKPRPKKGSK